MLNFPYQTEIINALGKRIAEKIGNTSANTCNFGRQYIKDDKKVWAIKGHLAALPDNFQQWAATFPGKVEKLRGTDPYNCVGFSLSVSLQTVIFSRKDNDFLLWGALEAFDDPLQVSIDGVETLIQIKFGSVSTNPSDLLPFFVGQESHINMAAEEFSSILVSSVISINNICLDC